MRPDGRKSWGRPNFSVAETLGARDDRHQLLADFQTKTRVEARSLLKSLRAIETIKSEHVEPVAEVKLAESAELQPAEPELAGQGEPDVDWALTRSPDERFTSYLATAAQALEAACAEARSNPGKFTRAPVEAAGQVEEIKQRARMIERRINAL